MLAKTISFGISGLDAHPVTIETDISSGLPNFIIVGLADTAVKESRERVRTAIKHSGYEFPIDHITINLAPADTKKEGPAFDVAIALSILSAQGCFPKDVLSTLGIVGELSLNGDLKPVNGVLAMAMSCRAAGLKGIIVPRANAAQASLVEGLIVYPASTLSEIAGWLMKGELPIIPLEPRQPSILTLAESLDFADVKGQLAVKRGLEIAAAGGHNVLICGSPGSGKTMLSRRMSTILPPMTWQESLEVTRIYSIVGQIAAQDYLISQRPVRSPHHTASNIALIGGGSHPKPGEVTLAHHGVLFLDELPEFSRHVLETLRQPLEEGHVTIARAKGTMRFPAKFMLIAAMNPCPCGFRHDTRRECRCTPLMIERYQQKISGPLMDRIDLFLNSPALKPEELMDMPTGEASQLVRERTCRARDIQVKRYTATPYSANAHIMSQHIKKFCPLSADCQDLLKNAMRQLHLSARAHDKIIKVARTIADLEGSSDILVGHVAEAVGYRMLEGMK